MRLRVCHQHSQFWPILASFMRYYLLLPNLARFMAVNHRFRVLEQFPQLTIPEVRLRVGHQHSQFWPILARFMGC